MSQLGKVYKRRAFTGAPASGFTAKLAEHKAERGALPASVRVNPALVAIAREVLPNNVLVIENGGTLFGEIEMEI